MPAPSDSRVPLLNLQALPFALLWSVRQEMKRWLQCLFLGTMLSLTTDKALFIKKIKIGHISVNSFSVTEATELEDDEAKVEAY